jgi:hypothetical protein
MESMRPTAAGDKRQVAVRDRRARRDRRQHRKHSLDVPTHRVWKARVHAHPAEGIERGVGLIRKRVYGLSVERCRPVRHDAFSAAALKEVVVGEDDFGHGLPIPRGLDRAASVVG